MVAGPADPPRSRLGKSLMVHSIEADPRGPRWHRRPDHRRSEILDAAVVAFGRQGYSRTTLADVAEHAGVSPGTVSHYFGSKARLFEDVIAERLMPLVETEEATLASHQGPMRDLLVQLLRRLWDRAWEPGFLDLMRVVKVESAEFPESGRVLARQLSERWRGIFGRILGAGREAGEFRPMDMDVAARTISYALIGVAEKLSAFGPYDPTMPDREVMWPAVKQMVERFVLAEPDRTSSQGEVE
ncbi:MAG TPA: TetR/AcrR family transcriptional regulator [Gemmatimonadales bacterium]|nr:TetR/AcrR family transcriptional regulator [Gemmatimonadales bacterium]